MISHADARTAATLGFKMKLGREPTRLEVQPLQGVGLLETQYSAGWRGAGVGSNNIGAVQAGRPPCDPEKAFLYTDSNPNPDGTSTTYSICFKKYPDIVHGFADVAQIMYLQMSKANEPYSVLEAAQSGDLYAVSEALYHHHYYTGFGATPAIRIANHYHALRSGVNAIAAALGEKMPDGFDPLLRVMKLTFPPLRNAQVGRVQRVVGFPNQDNWYGPKTRRAVINYQSAHSGLTADGVVGLDTWHVIQEDEQRCPA